MTAYQNILIKREERIGVIRLNRPDVYNALNNQTVAEILSAFESFENESDVDVIVFTGTGNKAFAAGADINQLVDRQPLDAFAAGSMTKVYRHIENSKKVTIAAINGYALGGGCELAIACDIRVASDHAKIGLPELNLSVIPGAGGTQRLARLIGKARALDLILTGEWLSAAEAKEIGLVSAVVPAEDLWETVREKARRISEKAPLAVQMAKLVVNRGSDTNIDTGLLIETLAQAVLYGTNDKKEGTKAFLEKRKASFTGN